MADRVLHDPVPAEMTAWAVSIRNDRVKFVLGYEESRVFADRTIIAKVEPHTFSGATGEKWDPPRPGVTLYERADTDPAPTSRSQVQAVGIDASHYQRGADFARVAAAGYSFVLAKATEGLTISDDAFDEHMQRAADAGLLRSAYHFYRASSPAVAQVRRFVELVADRAEIQLALDFEWQSSTAALGGLSPSEYADAIAQAVHELAQLIGRKPLVYTAAGWWTLVAPHIDPQVYLDAELWVANYSTKAAPSMPPGWTSWKIWQHSDMAVVAGIHGLSDVNRFAGTVDELRAWAKGTPPDTTDAGRILEIAKEVDEGREGLG